VEQKPEEGARGDDACPINSLLTYSARKEKTGRGEGRLGRGGSIQELVHLGIIGNHKPAG